MKTVLRPRNFSRASAYPARETRKTRPTVTSTVTITEFVNRPLPSAPFGALRVEGIRLGGDAVTVEVDATGKVVDVLAPDGVEVVVRGDL